MADAKIVSLKLHDRLYGQDERIGAVFFPIDSMVSLLAGTNKTQLVETATIGNEGVAGASELIQDQAAMGLQIVQLPGAAVRIDAKAFRELMSRRPLLKGLVERHLYALVRQILLGASCNRIHNMEQRCARWLLMTHDRAAKNTFPLTQEFLSNMLAVRRATVNAAIGGLKKAGLVRFVRGQITVLNRAGLESASCNCYPAIWRAYDYPVITGRL
jgi:CRP-like cAMP-binding protein